MGANLSALGQRLPQIALAFLAAKQGGPEAVAGLQAGIRAAEQRQQALQRQAALDEERRQAQAAQEARGQQADVRAGAAESRAAEDQRLQRLQAALQYLQSYEAQQTETATDPIAAKNAMLGRASSLESMFNVPQGQLAAAVPNLAPAISARKKRQAQTLYDRAEKLYGAEAMADDSITLQTGDLFGDVKPSQLRAVFLAPAVTATGEQARSMVSKPAVPNTPEEQFYQQYAAERGAKSFSALPTKAQAAARKQWMQADDRPTSGTDPEIALLRKDLLRLQVERAGEEKEPTQSQYTAATYATRMAQAEPILTAVTPSITGMGLPSFELQTNSWFAKPTFQSDNVQSFMQAARNFINAVLRRESGAVISPSEFLEARQQYLPQPNDSTEVLAQKAANRASVASSMKRAAGSAYEPPITITPALTKDAKVGGVYLYNGKKVKVREKTRTGFLFDEVSE